MRGTEHPQPLDPVTVTSWVGAHPLPHLGSAPRAHQPLHTFISWVIRSAKIPSTYRGRGVHCWGLPGRRAGPEGPSLCPRTDGQGVPRPVPPPPQVAPPLVREFPGPLPPGLFCDPPCRAPAPLSTPWEREGWTFPLHLRPSSWPREGSKWLCLTLRVLSPQSLAGPGGPTPSSRCPAAGRQAGCRGPAQCSKSYVWALSRR